MTNPNDLDTLRRDGLRGVATIGAGHAATALSQLTDRRIMISVPQVRRVNFGEVPAMVSLFGDHVAVVAQAHDVREAMLIDCSVDKSSYLVAIHISPW